MRCTVCGREAMNPEANYCDYCGSPFRKYGQEGWGNSEAESNRYETNAGTNDGYSAFGTDTYHRDTTPKEPVNQGMGDNKKITIWTFLGAFFLPLVPWVGAIAWIVLLLYWSVNSQVDDVRKNFARAYLIYMAVALIILLGLGDALMPAIQ